MRDDAFRLSCNHIPDIVVESQGLVKQYSITKNSINEFGWKFGLSWESSKTEPMIKLAKGTSKRNFVLELNFVLYITCTGDDGKNPVHGVTTNKG